MSFRQVVIGKGVAPSGNTLIQIGQTLIVNTRCCGAEVEVSEDPSRPTECRGCRNPVQAHSKFNGVITWDKVVTAPPSPASWSVWVEYWFGWDADKVNFSWDL